MIGEVWIPAQAPDTTMVSGDRVLRQEYSREPPYTESSGMGRFCVNAEETQRWLFGPLPLQSRKPRVVQWSVWSAYCRSGFLSV